MPEFLQQSWPAWAFLAYRKSVFLVLMALLALLRLALGRGAWARLWALAALLFSGAGIAATTLPAWGVRGSFMVAGGQLVHAGAGLVLPALIAGTMLLSGRTWEARGRWIDVLVWLAVAVLIGLWGWQKWG